MTTLFGAGDGHTKLFLVCLASLSSSHLHSKTCIHKVTVKDRSVNSVIISCKLLVQVSTIADCFDPFG
jgi:hypothetical protein